MPTQGRSEASRVLGDPDNTGLRRSNMTSGNTGLFPGKDSDRSSRS